MKRPAYYAPVGTVAGDLVTVLHPPYTAWHLSYVAFGAGLSTRVDWGILAATLLAFFFGTGITAHALDERNGRPLKTSLSDRTLMTLAVGGLVGSLGVAVIGAVRLSPWVLAWAGIGMALAIGYALEWPPLLHTTLGFGLAWGGFPVLVGFWGQTQTISIGSILVSVAATLLSMVQRTLSTPARFVRRKADSGEATFTVKDPEGLRFEEHWDEARLLATWELPLRLLAWSMVTLATGLLLARLIDN